MHPVKTFDLESLLKTYNGDILICKESHYERTNSGWVKKTIWMKKPINQVTFDELCQEDEFGRNGFYQPLVDCESGHFEAATYLFEKFKNQLKHYHIVKPVTLPDFDGDYLLLANNALSWGNPHPINVIAEHVGVSLSKNNFLKTFRKGAFAGKNSLWVASDAAANGRHEGLNFLVDRFAKQLKQADFKKSCPKTGRDKGYSALDCMRCSYDEVNATKALQRLVDIGVLKKVELAANDGFKLLPIQAPSHATMLPALYGLLGYAPPVHYVNPVTFSPFDPLAPIASFVPRYTTQTHPPVLAPQHQPGTRLSAKDYAPPKPTNR